MNEELLRVVIRAELDQFRRDMDSAKQKIKEANEEAKKGKIAFEDFNNEFQTIGEKSKGVLKAMGVGIVGLAGGLLALGQSGKEFSQSQAQLKTAFESAGGSAENATKTYNDLYRVLGDNGKATEAAQHLAKLTTEEKALSEWTNITKGVYATFGESLPIESLTEAVNHSAKLGEVQGTLADALEWSGINVDEFNEQLFWCNSESEREKLIRETLNGKYAEAAEQYEKNNKAVLDQNEAQLTLNDALAKLYEVTGPIMAMLASFLADILEPMTPRLKEFGETYGPQIKETLEKIADAVGKVITWIVDNWELVSTLAIIIASISAALTVFSTVMGIVNAVMAASPVTWIVLAIVAAIAALIAIIVLVIKYWDEIKAATKKCWDAIVNAVKTAVEWIVNLFTKLVDWVKGNWQGLLLLLVNPFAGAFKLLYDNCEGFRNMINTLFNNVKTVFTNIGSTIKEKFNAAATTIKSIIDKIKGFFKFDWSLPKLKVPKFSITPSGWSVGDLLKGSIPKLGITWNARGGVFDNPTVFGYGNSLQGLGENGAEAVVPLENNLEWLSKIADMLADRMNVGTPLYLNVDGKTFAHTVIKTVNANTKQTGKLDLIIV